MTYNRQTQMYIYTTMMDNNVVSDELKVYHGHK